MEVVQIFLKKKLNELFEKLDHLQENDILVLAGSIPSSLPSDIYEQIMKKLDQQGIKIIVDATNDLLKKVLPYHPFLIKPNHRELEELFNVKIENQEDLIFYARKLQEQGAINVLVSLGKDGAILVSEDDHVYYCAGAKGKLLNSVGSGDSMVAGFIAGYLKDKKYDLKNEVSVKTDYYRTPPGNTPSSARSWSRTLPSSTDLTVPSEEEAQTISGNWTKKNQELYALIMEHLL